MINDCKIPYEKDEVLSALSEFYDLYLQRPVKGNDGGMKSPHLFNTWFSLKNLQPELIIESGVWKGLGTWMIEKAVPEAKIISIEVDYSNIQYRSEKVIYLDRDITTYDWKKIFNEHCPGIDNNKIVIFLDDHQNFLQRLKFIYDLGIKHILYEGNYPPSQGDTFSPKKILARQNYVMDHAGDRKSHIFSYFDYDDFIERVEIYQELPPIYKTELTRWGDTWNDIKYPTREPLLLHDQKDKFPIFFEEANSYTWICYLGLSNS